MDAMFEGVSGERLRKVAIAAGVVLVVFLGVQAISSFMNLRYIGAGTPATNTISVTGYGEAFGVPDVATFTFTVTSQKTTVAAAQDDATARINAITEYLTGAGIEKKDIQTSDYSVYPQYEYNQVTCFAYPCPPTEQKLKGYEVRQTTTVKVRDTAKAGDLLTGVGGAGASEVSGLNFTFDDPDALQDDAREEAITDAREKAEMLADQLGVRLVRVVSYYEDGGYPGPMYYAKDASISFGMGGAEEVRNAPAISVGQNKVTSNVSVTYEIR